LLGGFERCQPTQGGCEGQAGGRNGPQGRGDAGIAAVVLIAVADRAEYRGQRGLFDRQQDLQFDRLCLLAQSGG
jgi:hypothetical protein